ncbi:MAG: hypothetical protein ACRD0L_07550 [Acidimicrobiales bacterium]
MSDGGGAAAGRWTWREAPRPPGPAVVVDLDGVLSDAGHRQWLLSGGRRDWEGFFDACGEDPLIEEGGRLLELLDPALSVVLLTGRPERVQRATLEWLSRHEVRWDLLLMRDAGDYSAARAFKARSVGELRAYGFDLRLALEDDRRNWEMFRAEGIPCLYLHSGYYEQAGPAHGR